MGRAGGRAGEGVSPLHAASGFNGLQQNPITPTGGSMAKQSSFGTPASSGNQNPLQMAFEQNNSNLQNINDLHSLFPQLSSTNSVNELLMQYRKAQHEQQQSAQAQAQANAFQQSGANTAHLQAQLLGVARNGQFAEQLSQMQAMLMQQAQHNNFDGVQAAAQRLGSGTHPLQVSFDLASQQQNMLGSPATRPVPSFQTEALPAQNTQDLFISSHQHVSALQNPPTRSNNPAFSFGNGADMARSAHHQQQQHHQRQQQQQQELAAESSGVESADEGAAAAGKGDRKEARKEYHKRIERKRRDRMRNLYDELRSLVNPDEPADKNSVLAGAVSLIQELRDENIKLQSRVHIKEKRSKNKGGETNLQIKVFKGKDKEEGKKGLKEEGGGLTAEGARDAEEVAMAGRAREAAAQEEEAGGERMSGEETSEGSEQGGASKTSDSVTDGGQDGSEQGASKRSRLASDPDAVLSA